MVRIAAKATKGKGKRWQKGQSSSSNPTSNKHRTKIAQANSGQSTSGSLGQFKLTKDLLEKFDKINQQKQRQAELSNIGENQISNWIDKTETNDKQLVGPIDDAVSLGNTSVASVWTNCSNISFNKFLNGFDAKSKIHRSMLTVLATVREAIELENGKETETEYFAALMLALNYVDSEEKLTATLSLIQLVLRRVPVAVLKLKFSETSSSLLKILSERSSFSSPNIYLLKSVISSLGVLLKPQEKAIWELNSTQRIFETLLLLVIHVKPRIRKAASTAVISLVCDGQCPGAPVTRRLLAEFATRKLEEHLTTTHNDHLSIVLYIFNLLGETMSLFPSVLHTKKACEAMLSHMTLGNVLIVTAALQTFYTFFMKRPKAEVLSPELNGQLVNALYDYQPNINDAQPLSAWCTALKEALLSLALLDAEIGQQHLMKYTKTLITCLQSDSVQVHLCVCGALLSVFVVMVIRLPKEEHFEGEPVKEANDVDEEKIQIPVELAVKLYNELEQVLKYQYSQAWVHAIGVLGKLLVDDPVLVKPINKIIQRMAILRESNDEAVNAAIDRYFGQAVALFGPSRVLECCPIEWRAGEAAIGSAAEVSEFNGEFTNSWLLPILRQHVGTNKVELNIWVDRFLPMADDIWRKSINCAKLAAKLKEAIDEKMDVDNEKSVNSAFTAHESCLAATKELKRCVHAIWSLLPSFSKNAIDVKTSFPKIAKRLGETMYKKEFIAYPLRALKNLFKSEDKSIGMVVGKFAKNYLPILFNVYTNEKEEESLEVGMRMPVLRLIEQFLPQLFEDETNSKLFSQFYQQINIKLAEEGVTDFKRNALLDLQRAFLVSPKGLEVADIEALYSEVGRMLMLENGANTARGQKNGLRILEEIIKSSSPACEQFILAKKIEIVKFLFDVLDKPKNFRSPSTRALALRAMQRLIEKLATADGAKGKLAEWREVFERLLPIVYHTLLLKSAKAIKSAREMLLMLVDAFQALEAENEEFQLVKMLVDPLINDDKTISLTERTARLAAIVFLYGERYHQPAVPQSLECHIADVVVSQMQNQQLISGSRQVLDICFNFIKLFMSKANSDVLESYIEAITGSITTVPAQHRLKFRMRIRVLLIKLIRKHGFELISKIIPEDYQKVLKNIRKEEIRKVKNKGKSEADSNEDEDEDESDDGKSKRSRRSRKSRKGNLFDSEDEDEIEQFIETDIGGKMFDDDEEEMETDKRTMKKGAQQRFDITSRLSNKTNKSFIRESAEGDPIDLLDPSANKSVFSKIPRKFKQANVDTNANNIDNNNGEVKLKTIPMANDGRIIIKDLLEQIDKKTPNDSVKRKAPEDDSDDDEDESIDKNTVLSYRPGGRGIHRPLSVASGLSKRSNKSRKSANKETISRGDVYSSKSARGDMKRRGRPDPYAYYPLNPMAMNKRKALKYKGEFKKLVKRR